MTQETARIIAEIIREPYNRTRGSVTHFDEYRALVIVVRTRACISMEKPVEVIQKTTEEILANYPELGAWAEKTASTRGAEYLFDCMKAAA